MAKPLGIFFLTKKFIAGSNRIEIIKAKMNKIKILIFVTILAGFAVGLFFYPQTPERMASHWGIKNNVNGFMPKFWGLFLMPIISLVLYLFFISLHSSSSSQYPFVQE